jgi:hypothetical protein
MNKRDTEIEVILDLDKLPKDIGTPVPSGRMDYSEDDVEAILDWAEDKIATEYPITVVIRGHCPHFILVPLQHVVEMHALKGSVVRYDFVPINAPRFTVFDHTNTDEVMV